MALYRMFILTVNTYVSLYLEVIGVRMGYAVYAAAYPEAL